MKRKYGKITLYAIWFMVVFAIVFTWTFTRHAQAASAAHNLVIPYNGEAAITVVFALPSNASLIDADLGTIGASWADAEIEASQDATSNDWIIAIPSTQYNIFFCKVYHVAAASVDKTTVPSRDPFLYDTGKRGSFTDAVQWSY